MTNERRIGLLAGGVLLVLTAALIAPLGCDHQSGGPRAQTVTTPEDVGDSLFNSAYELLDRLPDFESDEGLTRSIERFNQWLIQQPADPGFKVDPLVASLPSQPPGLAELPALKRAGSPRLLFDDPERKIEGDSKHFLEATWMRSISNLAKGTKSDELLRAQSLFDWVIRNVQLEADLPTGNQRAPHAAWEVLLFGRGTAEQRAWVFSLLARQQRMEVVMLALPDEKRPGGWRPWLPALWRGQDLHLFDSALGLPIPGPEGKGVATLAQVQADDNLLRHLDTAEAAYPLKSADLKKTAVWIEASPAFLSRRMALIEAQLAGDRTLALSVKPSKLAERLKDVPGVDSVALWPLPYVYRSELQAMDQNVQQAIQREWAPLVAVQFPSLQLEKARKKTSNAGARLLRGRILHFAGRYTGDDTYITENAGMHYMAALMSEDERRRAGFPPEIEATCVVAKQNALYWLGLMAFERGQYPTAITYFKNRTLDDNPDGPWTNGAEYNLARTYEALAAAARVKGDAADADKNLKDALKLYETDLSPQAQGNALRAKWLRERTTEAGT